MNKVLPFPLPISKTKTSAWRRFLFCVLLLFLYPCIALAAINRPVLSGTERHFRFAAARSAGGGKHFAVTVGSVLSSITTGLAALWLVDEASLGVEFLLTGGEHEFGSTFLAAQGLVFVHFTTSLTVSFTRGPMQRLQKGFAFCAKGNIDSRLAENHYGWSLSLRLTRCSALSTVFGEVPNTREICW
jgi:hypothetical protein